jgi:hypothetical protein
MRLLISTCLIAVLLSACGPAATPIPAAVESPRALVPESLNTATLGPESTPTEEPFTIQFTPIPTDTALPALELSTPLASPPALQIWDGLPTYPSESKPDFDFRLRFDPDVWASTTDNFGFPALAHRSIADCTISPAAGRGMPNSVSMEHDVRTIGNLDFDVTTAYLNGIKQFVNYAGGDANIYTAFQVSFQEQPDHCLADAEVVLATLRSVPASQATPIATP